MSQPDALTRTVVMQPPPPGGSAETPAAPSVAAPAASWLEKLRLGVAAALAALVLLAVVRWSFVDGVVRRLTIAGPSMAAGFCGPHYQVTCGDCGFAFRCDAEHPPADGRAACPNCGFVKNELDRAELRPADRVLLDRWPWRPTQVGDVVAAAHAEGELVVKRVVASEPRQVAIRDGDLFIGNRRVQKSLAELRGVRMIVHDDRFRPARSPALPPRWEGASPDSRWRPAQDEYERDAAAAEERAFDWLAYRHWAGVADERTRGVAAAVRDNDSYNQGETRRPLNVVPDVLLTCWLQAEGEGELAFAAQHGPQRFEVVVSPGKRLTATLDGRTLVEQPLALRFARRFVPVEFGLCDRQVLLSIAGQTLLRLPYERPANQPADTKAPLAIGARGLRVAVRELKVWRDLYYLDPQGLDRGWTTPAAPGPGEVVLLGDNPPVSIDSRQWTAPGVALTAIRGRVYAPFWSPARAP